VRTSHFFMQKNFGFFEIYTVSARTRGVDPVRTFCGKGEGSIFLDVVRMSFMDGPQVKNFRLPTLNNFARCLELKIKNNGLYQGPL